MNFDLNIWRSHHQRPYYREWEDVTSFAVSGADSREDLIEKLVQNFELVLDEITHHLAHDVMAYSIKTYLRLPNRNHYTAAIANSVMDAEEQADDTAIQHALIFMREIERKAPELLQAYVDDIVQDTDRRSSSYGKYRTGGSVAVEYLPRTWVRDRQDDTNGIMELIEAYKGNSTLRHYMEDGEFIRNQYFLAGKATLLTQANQSFVTIAGKGGSASVPPQTSIMLGDGWTAFPPPTNLLVNQTAGVSVSVEGLPFHININSDASNAAKELTVLKDATQAITLDELKRGFTVNSIAPPAQTTTILHDQTIAVGVTQSVNVANLFTGRSVVITVGTSNASIATAQISSGETSIGIVGRAVGTAKITVTGTNVAGSTSVEFNVTVTA